MHSPSDSVPPVNRRGPSLSSPFMDGSSACGFFDMILGLFIETDIGTSGKMVGKLYL